MDFFQSIAEQTLGLSKTVEPVLTPILAPFAQAEDVQIRDERPGESLDRSQPNSSSGQFTNKDDALSGPPEKKAEPGVAPNPGDGRVMSQLTESESPTEPHPLRSGFSPEQPDIGHEPGKSNGQRRSREKKGPGFGDFIVRVSTSPMRDSPVRSGREANPPLETGSRRGASGGTSGRTVEVSIGRVEVRAIMQPKANTPRRRTSAAAPVLSLDDYLKQRNGSKP